MTVFGVSSGVSSRTAWRSARNSAHSDTRRKRAAYAKSRVRPAAEGIYAIVQHGNHTHLTYVIELPEREGPVEHELNIAREASYIIAVRNPEAPRPTGMGLDPGHDAKFLKELREKFACRKFLPVKPPDLLNYQGAELIFIGASEDPERELGIEFKPDRENEHSADVFRDLKLPRKIARQPLFKGGWA